MNPFDIFLPVVDFFTRALIVLQGVIPSWGLAIIVFTLIVKAIMFPLTWKQLKSSRAMQEMQPALREIQKKYGKDREKLAEEQMKLYKERGINPMAGCLPLLIQMPIWIALYQALWGLSNAVEGSALAARVPEALTAHSSFISQGFLWISNLGMPEGAPYLLAILTGVTQWIVQRMTMPVEQDPQQATMNKAMQFMPLMFVFFAFTVPSGLVLYWVVSNLISMVTQYFVTGWGSLANLVPALAGKGPTPGAAAPKMTGTASRQLSGPSASGTLASTQSGGSAAKPEEEDDSSSSSEPSRRSRSKRKKARRS